jgi:hypothetical protein
MSLLTSQDRDALRGAWRESWRRYRLRLPLEPLQAQMADLIALHPEYHALLGDETTGLPGDHTADAGAGNSAFLHLALHMALREQLTTNRPAGIHAAYQRLARSSDSPHAAEHRMIEVLGQTLWEAQRAGRAPDEQQYLQALERL